MGASLCVTTCPISERCCGPERCGSAARRLDGTAPSNMSVTMAYTANLFTEHLQLFGSALNLLLLDARRCPGALPYLYEPWFQPDSAFFSASAPCRLPQGRFPLPLQSHSRQAQAGPAQRI